MAKPLDGQVALITGASRGIGAATARALARAGAHVILVGRTVGALEALDDHIRSEGGQATLVPLDLRKHELIDPLAATIYSRWGRLDILVANAAMLGALTPMSHLDPKLWQEVMDVNVTANYRLIRALDPLLRQSANAQAIFVTSSISHEPTPFWGVYAASKAALEHIAQTYAKEVAHTGVQVELWDPGVVKTALRAQAFPGEDASQLPSPDSVVGQLLEQIMARHRQAGDTQQQTA